MIGPKNKILGKDFLKIAIDYLVKKSNLYETYEKNERFYSFYCLSEIYKDFIKKEPYINYNDEKFYITNIHITDKPVKNTITKTYKNEWEYCDKSEYTEKCCDSDSDDIAICEINYHI